VAIVATLVAALGAYTAYAGAYGSQVFTEAITTEPGCTTPALAYGWTYEAINYDLATDAALAKVPRADGQAGWDCTASPAGGGVRSSDGVALAGWYIPAASEVGPLGPTVIVVPGWKDGKSDTLKYAPAFHDDYNLVIMDVRNVGQSERRPTTMGLDERLDVRAMIDWLTATKGATSIALVGDSQGAATSLAEAVDDPRVDALILDSMHATFVAATGNAMEVDFGQPAVPGSWAIALGVSLRVGEDVTSIDPIKTIGRVGDRPVLLTHGTADQVDPPAQSIERNLRAAREAGVAVELLYCPGAAHGQTIDTCPEAWAHRATSFLEGALPR
jgi:pimeloyl-ACP methyl ester carboxylesterase